MVTKQCNDREWARQFTGTASEFMAQAKKRGLTNRSIKHWVKYNWNIGV